MMTEMHDPMVPESHLAARAGEKHEAMSKNGVFENSVVESPGSGVMQVTEEVVMMETSAPALPHCPVGDAMSKHEDGAQTESALEQDLALPTEPSAGGIASEVPFQSSSFSSPNSGYLNGIAGEGTAVAQKKRKNRVKNWVKKDTDDLLRAVLSTTKASIRMEQGTDGDSYWDVIAKVVPDRTGDECRGRMDGLKRSFSTIKEYCDKHKKEFNELNFCDIKVSPELTEDWYNQIRDHCPPKKKSKTDQAGSSSKIRDRCPPRPKKKSKTNRAGSASKSTGFIRDTPTSGLQPAVLPDQGLPTLVDPPGSQPELPIAAPLLQQAPPTPELPDDSLQALLSSFEDGFDPDLASILAPLSSFKGWLNSDVALP